MSADARLATRLVGANPQGALRTVSLAVRRALAPLEPDVPLVIGLSGGPDSLALALATIDLATRARRRVLTATVDHGLRPESHDEARSVVALAEELGADAHLLRVEVGRACGPEGAARAARRRALAGLAHAEGAHLLLGHTMNDQAETVLLRLARGSGAGSLRAMSPDLVDEEGLRWIRPLLRVPGEATRRACAQAGLSWVEDPTNRPDGPWRAEDGSALRRSAVRAEALPALARALGLDPVPALARSAELAARDDEALRAWAEAEWGRVRVDAPLPGGGAEGGGAIRRPALDARALATLPIAIRTRILRRYALGEGARAADLSARHLDKLDALITRWRGQGPIALPGVEILRLRDAQGRPVLLARHPEEPGPLGGE